MTTTLSPSERATLRGLLSDPVAYIENLLWIRDMDDRIVVQQRGEGLGPPLREGGLDCTDPKVAIARVRGWISDLS